MNDLHDKLMVMEENPVMTKCKVIIDKNKCIGTGGCVGLARLTFRLGEDGKVAIIDQDGNGDEEKLVAAKACPMSAITIINTETGETVWPK